MGSKRLGVLRCVPGGNCDWDSPRALLREPRDPGESGSAAGLFTGSRRVAINHQSRFLSLGLHEVSGFAHSSRATSDHSRSTGQTTKRWWMATGLYHVELEGLERQDPR